jgi:hypothetical protein
MPELNFKWILAFLIALANDAFDYILGWTPVVGDFIDLITAGFIYGLTGEPLSFAGLAELVPGADWLPIMTGATIFAWLRHKEVD